MKPNFFVRLSLCLLVAAAFFSVRSANAQIDADIQALEAPAGVFEFSTSYNPGSGVVEYQWNFGDGFSASGNPVTHAFSFGGSYPVSLVVLQDGGVVATGDTVLFLSTVTCDITPQFVFSLIGNGEVIFDQNSISASGNIVSLHWDFGDGTTADDSTAIWHTYAANGVYTVCLTVQDDLGCTDTVCQSVPVTTVSCSLQPYIAYSTYTAANTVTYESTVVGATFPLAYSWLLLGGTPSTSAAANPVVNYPNPGSYGVCLTVTDATGCSATVCDSVIVGNGGCPSQLINVIANTTGSNTVGFMLNGFGGQMPYLVTADYGDGTAPVGPVTMTTATNLTHDYLTAGMFEACFYISDAAGCTDTICQDVNTACPPMAATFIVNDLTGGFVELSGVATGGIGTYTYTWSPAASLSASSGATVVSSAMTTTTYCVTAVDINGCSASYCAPVTPACNVEAEFTYSIAGNSGTATIDAPVAGTEYVWNINGTTYVGPSINFFVTTPGTYDLCMQATSGNCYSIQCEVIQFTISNADTISGFVWSDANGNGFWDAGEEPMEQALVILCQPNDTNSCQYAYTDINGMYVFIVAPDTYEITAANWWSTYVQTFPVSPTVYTVASTGNQNLTGFDFGFQDQGVIITGCIFYDTNNNGVQDLGESGAAYQYVEIDGWWYYTNSDGCYSVSVVPGTYTIDYTPPASSFYVLSTPGSFTASASTAGQTYGPYSFGLYADPLLQNLCVNVSPWTTVTPGFPAWYYISYCNYGASPASGTVTYTWDPGFTVDAFSPSPTSISGNTATWDFTNLLPGQCQTIYADFLVPFTFVLGTPVTTGATITPIAGDVYPDNNIDTTHQTVVGSWDPNMKEVMPTGSGLNGTIDPDHVSKLTYTVHFQNTGTAPAVNVVLIDTLSANVDWSTFKMNDASHGYTLDFNPTTGIAQWTFNNIMLPDSGADYQASMGFVEFEINLVENLNEGTEIENFADIYFDFNEPVRTNTVVNTIEEELSVNALVDNVKIGVMPNPASEHTHFVVTGLRQPDYKVIVRNVLGQKVAELSSNGQKATMQRQGLVSGIFSFEIISNLTILGTGTFVLE